MALAKERWRMLRSILLENKRTNGYEVAPLNSSSVRRFSSFDLFTVSVSKKPTNSQKINDELIEWSSYTYKSTEVEVALLPGLCSLEELQGFNNTGNVCIWPSEEIMTYYCLENIEEFRNTSLCELGAGMTGLAGMMIAKTCYPKETFVTDGNERSVVNLQSIVNHNSLRTVIAESVIWKDGDLHEEYQHLRARFDIILCADCLFFTQSHKQLIDLLLYLLKPSGKVYMFAPERDGSLRQFCSLADSRFHIEVLENYSDIVWKKHVTCVESLSVYNPDIHYPKLITMTQKNTECRK